MFGYGAELLLALLVGRRGCGAAGLWNLGALYLTSQLLALTLRYCSPLILLSSARQRHSDVDRWSDYGENWRHE
jgi:hypothetical protein